MSGADRIRRYVAPVAVAATAGIIVFAAVQPRSAPADHDPIRGRAPHPATTTSSPYWTLPSTTTTPGNPQVAMDAVQWTQVAYPGVCGSAPSTTAPATTGQAAPGSSTGTTVVSTGFTVDQVSFSQPSDDTQLALVLVQCGTGVEPVGFYVYEGALSVTDPTLVQTLIPTAQDVFAASFSLANSKITIQVQSGAPDQDGACCSGLSYDLSWSWSNGTYRAAS